MAAAGGERAEGKEDAGEGAGGSEVWLGMQGRTGNGGVRREWVCVWVSRIFAARSRQLEGIFRLQGTDRRQGCVWLRHAPTFFLHHCSPSAVRLLIPRPSPIAFRHPYPPYPLAPQGLDLSSPSACSPRRPSRLAVKPCLRPVCGVTLQTKASRRR